MLVAPIFSMPRITGTGYWEAGQVVAALSLDADLEFIKPGICVVYDQITNCLSDGGKIAVLLAGMVSECKADDEPFDFDAAAFKVGVYVGSSVSRDRLEGLHQQASDIIDANWSTVEHIAFFVRENPGANISGDTIQALIDSLEG